MKRVYRQIGCYMKDVGRCKYASFEQTNAVAPGRTLPKTCFCEKIDEEMAKEREMFEYIMTDMQMYSPSVPTKKEYADVLENIDERKPRRYQ